MKSKPEMHPRILERRRAVFMNRLPVLSDEEAEENLSACVGHYEGKLPRPENYRKKTVERLRTNLRTIDGYLSMFESRRDDRLLHDLCVMYERHRAYIVKELARRMLKRA